MLLANQPTKGVGVSWADYADSLDVHVRGQGGVLLDAFPGADDDARLTAALSYVAAQSVKPPILFGSRLYTFSQAGRTMFSGLKLAGGPWHGDQQRSANSIPNDIRFTGTGTWWQLAAGNVFDVGIYGLSFQGGSGSQFMAGGASVLWTSVIRDVGFNLWKSVLGNPAEKLLLTACTFDGWWNINNSRDTAVTIGGSDCNLWMSGCLLDSPTSLSKAGAPHLILDYLEKSGVGPMYITAEGGVSAIRVNGSASAEGLVLYGQGRAEGRNAGAPTTGAVVTLTGGNLTIRDWSINYANPGQAAPGVINQSGGRLLLSGVSYDRAAGLSEDSPLLAVSGGYARVRDVMTGAKGGAWSMSPPRPAVHASVTGVIDADNSVRVL